MSALPESLSPRDQGLIVELYRFRVLPGKEEKAREWIEFLRSHPGEFLHTLPGEQMFIETIFSDVSEGHLHLSWYSVQGSGAQETMEFESELDQKHLAYHRECIDPEWGPKILTPELIAVPDHLRQLMTSDAWPDTP